METKKSKLNNLPIEQIAKEKNMHFSSYSRSLKCSIKNYLLQKQMMGYTDNPRRRKPLPTFFCLHTSTHDQNSSHSTRMMIEYLADSQLKEVLVRRTAYLCRQFRASAQFSKPYEASTENYARQRNKLQSTVSARSSSLSLPAGTHKSAISTTSFPNIFNRLPAAFPSFPITLPSTQPKDHKRPFSEANLQLLTFFLLVTGHYWSTLSRRMTTKRLDIWVILQRRNQLRAKWKQQPISNGCLGQEPSSVMCYNWLRQYPNVHSQAPLGSLAGKLINDAIPSCSQIHIQQSLIPTSSYLEQAMDMSVFLAYNIQ